MGNTITTIASLSQIIGPEHPLRDHPLQDGILKEVINDTRLPRMVGDPVKDALQASRGLPTMAATPAATQVAAGQRAMKAFTAPTAESLRSAGPVLPKEEMKQHDTPATIDEGYVRLRLRVTNDQVRVVGVQNVEGPLDQGDSFVGEHAYEVSLDAKRIAVEGITDLGIRRSFARPGQHEHHITELPTFEFNVRVPRMSLPDGALDRLNVTLYRFPDAGRKPIAPSGLLRDNIARQAKVIASIQGMRPEHIDPTAVDQLKRVFPNSKLLH